MTMILPSFAKTKVDQTEGYSKNSIYKESTHYLESTLLHIK